MTGLKTNERPGTRAVLRHSRVAPNKVREVLDLVRNRPVHEAEDILRFSERDAAFLVGKVLASAVANAEHNEQADREELYVSACFADEGTTIKRWRPRARGRATRIRKRTTHITVIVGRLPEDRLQRLQSHRRAEQLVERSRRVAGARRSGATEDDTRSRVERRRRGRAAEEVTAAESEAGIVDPTGEGVAALETAEGAVEPTTPAPETEADESEIVDQTGEGVAALETAEADDTAAEAARAEDSSDADDTKDGR
ncbi:MAG: 50S ribosomal protein L22 [Actinomycetota bacterium]|nr:50S ribosomal protein L22 [Actinomycetota bacterium]